MILGVGLDVVETKRVARALEAHGRRFEQRIYTPTELADCAERGDRIQALAARLPGVRLLVGRLSPAPLGAALVGPKSGTVAKSSAITVGPRR